MDSLPSVILKPVEPDDVDFMLDCENFEDNTRWSDYRAPLSRNQLMTYALTYDADPFASGQLRLIVWNEGERVGIVDLYDISEKDGRAFVGICIHPSKRNNGYGCSSLLALNALARQRLGLRALAAKISEINKTAISVFKRVGYNSVSLLPAWHKIGAEYHDIRLLVLYF